MWWASGARLAPIRTATLVVSGTSRNVVTAANRADDGEGQHRRHGRRLAGGPPDGRRRRSQDRAGPPRGH